VSGMRTPEGVDAAGCDSTLVAPLRHATLVVNRLRANEPFRPGAGPNGGDFFLPWRQLRDRFAVEGVELNTRDVNAERKVDFELHLNAQRSVDHPFSYAYLYEDPIVRPINGNLAELARYRKLFTSNEDLIDGEHVVALDYPNDLALRDVPDFRQRDLFCVLIASNKALLHPHPRNLHHRRVEAIRFFEAHAPDRFALFGPGWDIPAVEPGHLGRIAKRFIDGDQFKTPHEMLAFIERIDAGHFAMYQHSIREFLASPAAQRFTNAHWCDSLVTRILADVQQA
jgi:hypothetical protein